MGLGESQRGTRENAGSDAGSSADSGSALDAGPDGGTSCERASDCDDVNPCTIDACTGGLCQHAPAGAGLSCGTSVEGECRLPDACDGAGRCVTAPAPAATPCGRMDNACAADRCDGAGTCMPQDLPAGTPCGGPSGGCAEAECNGGGQCVHEDEPNGSACPGGSCTLGACVQGQAVGCPQRVVTSVPFEAAWSSAGLPDLFRGDCESNDTPDYAVQFVVPAAGRYRFQASGSPDSVLTLARGACSTADAAQIDPCNDDIANGNLDSRIDVALTAGQTITVYVSAFGNGNGGNGTLRITAL